MNIFQAIILGLVQGFTEFLPISSSGHLVIAQKVLQVPNSDSLVFEIIIHLATLLAVIIFFYKDIIKLKINDYFLLGIGTIPAVIFGVFFKDFIEKAFGSLLEVGVELLITAALLFFAHWRLHHAPTSNHQTKDVTPLQSFIIGIWQAIAILPGISRSGATVAGALFMNIDRDKAFRFSFLLSIPAILGAAVLAGVDMFQSNETIEQSIILPYLVGAVAAFVTGLISLYWFQLVIKKSQLHFFGMYCTVIGLTIILFSLWG